MPVPALPVEPHTHFTFTRSYNDPLNRPMTGRVTAKRLDPPFLEVSAELDNGNLILALEPGRYSLGAMLRTVDNARAYIAEEVTITQENS